MSMLQSVPHEQPLGVQGMNENATETNHQHYTWKGLWKLVRIQLNNVIVPNLYQKFRLVLEKKEHYKTWNECLVKDSRSIVPYLIHSEKLHLTDETRTKLCTFLQSLTFTETAWVSFLKTLPPGSVSKKKRSLVKTTASERVVDNQSNKRFKSETMHQPTSLPQPKLIHDLSNTPDTDMNSLPTLTGTREGIEEEKRRQKMEKAKRNKLNTIMSEHMTQLKACAEKTEQFEKENAKLKEQLLQFTNGLSPTTVLKARRAMEQQNDAERLVECPVCFLQHGQHETYCTERQ